MLPAFRPIDANQRRRNHENTNRQEHAMYTDADIEQAEWDEVGTAHAAAKAAGRCTHTSGQGANPTRAPHLTGTQIQCRDCGAVFADDSDWLDAIHEAID